jgi:hypothetical protein
VVVYEFLKLRNLRMTMRSGGLSEVDDEYGTQKLVLAAVLTVGC